jgi:hypothetical protein
MKEAELRKMTIRTKNALDQISQDLETPARISRRKADLAEGQVSLLFSKNAFFVTKEAESRKVTIQLEEALNARYLVRETPGRISPGMADLVEGQVPCYFFRFSKNP